MRIGVGLPTTLPGAAGALVLRWAREADTGPFTSLGVLDRVCFDSYDPLTALAAAAAVTERVHLATTIVIAPLRPVALLAKSARTLDALSGGRLVLGLSVGARRDDYTAAGVTYESRGRRLTDQLRALRNLWDDESMGPRTRERAAPPVLVGGLSDAAYARVARYADGYVHGGGPPRAFARAADAVQAAWADAGRPGRPLLWGQGYFAFGDAAIAAGTSYLRDYYAFTGGFVERIVDELLTTPQSIAHFLRGYAEAGCDELVLFPACGDVAQLHQLGAVLEQIGWADRATSVAQAER